MKDNSKLTQWHPAFCSAIELTFIEDADKLIFDREKTLNTKPLEIDLVVIKKVKDVVLRNNIGKRFQENNILEYKSPNDRLSMNTLFKVMAYACLYKSYETPGNPIPVGSISVTLLRMRKPVKLMKELQEYGWILDNPYPGVYYINGDTFLIPIQIIVTKELEEDDCLWLKAIQNDVSSETAIKLIRLWGNAGSEYETKLMDSVMQVSVEENAETYDIVKEEDTMCQAMLDLMKPEIDQAVEQAKTAEKNSAIDSLAKWLKSQDPSLSEKEALDTAKKILG